MSALPSGNVTFCFTDIEGSTQLFAKLGPSFLDVLEQHRRIIREAVAEHGGHEVKTEGDGFFLAFGDAANAVAACMAFQQALAAYAWPEGGDIRVRVGVHSGSAQPAENDYAAFAVHEAARVGAAGHGGQVVVSDAIRAQVEGRLPADVSLKDLGAHDLKDIGELRLYQLCHPKLERDFPPLRATGAPRGYIPATASSLIGRDHDVTDLIDRVSGSRLVTITGSGGVGKTRLAIEVARAQLGRPTDGVWFVDLASVTDAERVPEATLQALGVVREPTLSASQQLVAYLRGRDALLVVDNCEHLLDACVALVNDVLAGCPRVSFLTTSRESLGVDGELGWRARSLDTDAATQLFTERALLVRPDAFDDANEHTADAVGRIVERLDGIPLAIELAAARMRVLTAPQIAERLHDRFSLLTGGRKTALARQRTLEATVDWSYALLDDDERGLLRALSVFVGGFDLAAAEAVWTGDALDVLDRLVDKSMVVTQLAGEAIRYRLLETIRQYGWLKLVDAGEATAARQRHARHVADFLDEVTPGLRDERETRAAKAIDAEHQNIRAALEWVDATEDHEVALRLIAQVWLPWAVLGHTQEALDWLKRLLPHVQGGDAELLALAHAGAAHVAWIAQVPRDEMAEYADRAVAHARSRAGAGRTWYDAWALSLLTVGTEREAALIAEAVEWAELANDPFVQAQVHARRAEIAYDNQSAEEADAAFDAVFAGARRGPWSAQSYSLQVFAYRAAERGEFDAAVDYALESLATARRGPNVYFVCFGLHAVGFCKGMRGDADAVVFLREAIDITRQRDLTFTQSEAEVELAWILMSAGDAATARAHLERAVDLLAPLSVGNPSMTIFAGLARLGIAETLQMEQRYGEAAEIFEQTLALVEAIGLRPTPVGTLVVNSLGLLRLEQGDVTAAESLFNQALGALESHVDTVRAVHSRAVSVRGLAGVARARGDFAEAASKCGATASVHEIFRMPRLSWIRYGELVAALRDELGDDFDAAWERGVRESAS